LKRSLPSFKPLLNKPGHRQYAGHIQETIWDFNAGLGLSNFILEQKKKLKDNKEQIKSQTVKDLL